MRYLISLILVTLITYAMGQVRRKAIDQDKEKKKRIEVYTKWMHKNDIAFRSLPKTNPKDLTYDCDSTLILKQTKGDTLIFWTESSSYTTGGRYLDYDIEQLDKLIKDKSFGLTDYVEKLDDQGNVVLVSLRPDKFKFRNDSLFRLTSFFKIPQDSIDKAIDARDFKLAEKLLKENGYYKFVLIFHPSIFKNGEFNTNEAGDSITLDHIWKVGEKKYYEISFNRDSLGTKIKFPTYLFDDHFRFLEYDGCTRSEINQLTKEREIEITD